MRKPRESISVPWKTRGATLKKVNKEKTMVSVRAAKKSPNKAIQIHLLVSKASGEEQPSPHHPSPRLRRCFPRGSFAHQYPKETTIPQNLIHRANPNPRTDSSAAEKETIATVVGDVAQITPLAGTLGTLEANTSRRLLGTLEQMTRTLGAMTSTPRLTISLP